MDRSEIEVGDGAVEKATGRDWDGWLAWLDARDGRELSHRDIVALLREEGGIDSGWWQQMVTNGYEKLIGRRETGETQGTGYQVGAQKTVDAPADAVWAWAASPDGLRAWLGDGDVPELTEGATYELADGSAGEVRVVRPGDRVRLTWHPPEWPRPSTIQLRVTPHDDPGRAVIGFHQEHIPGSDEREEARARLKRGLAAIAGAVTLAVLAFLPVAASAQVSPHADLPEEGEDFCAQVVLRTEDRVFGHEYTQFLFMPEVADDPRSALAAGVPEAPGADRVALWWTAEPDSVHAWMVGAEDTVWRLRLGRLSDPFMSILRGTLEQALPPGSPHVARADVVPMPCRTDPFGGR